MKKLQTKDVGKLLDVSPQRVRQLADDGTLRPERIGSSQTRVFDVEDVRRVKAEREKQKR